MRATNMIVSIVIMLGGLGYIIFGAHKGETVCFAVGWAMLSYARISFLKDDIDELKKEIKDLKEKLKK